MKKLSAFVLALVAALSLTACSGGENTDTSVTTVAHSDSENVSSSGTGEELVPDVDINIMTLKGPTGMGMAKLLEDGRENYKVTLASSPDEISPAIINGTCDIAAIPTNLAAVLYQKTQGTYFVAAVNTLGVLYMLENGNTVNTVEDLRGKTIYATGQGSTPEYILRYVLSENNIDPDRDVTLEFKAEHTELTALLAADRAAIGMLPEPNVTTAMTQNSSLRVALDITQLWRTLSPDSSVMQGCIVVKKTFAEANKAALDRFLDDYAASVAYVNENLDEGASLIAKHGIVPSEAIAKAALPRCNIVFIPGAEAKTQLLSFLQVLFDANPKSTGGAMPDEGFIYER